MKNIKKKILIITGARSEYGIMKKLISKLSHSKHFSLDIIATGSHISSKFGNTYKEIEKDGFKISKKINILSDNDKNLDIIKSMSIALTKISNAVKIINPDFTIILGDRYEAFISAQCCCLLQVPIAHIHGGEITEGAVDDVFRHSITKMSQIHFVASEEYRKRVIQLGENPTEVYNVGSLGVEGLVEFMDNNSVRRASRTKRLFVITYHPETYSLSNIAMQIENLLTALDCFNDFEMVFTFPNADESNNKIIEKIQQFINKEKKTRKLVKSLGQSKYWNLLSKASLVIGNSSSGIIEAPVLKIPTINIGDRQKGRLKALSIIDTNYETENIISAIKYGLSKKFLKVLSSTKSLYGVGNTSDKILEILFKKEKNLKKTFFNLDHEF